MSDARRIYLDNAATTRVDERVCALVQECMLEVYGNPSSAHSAGIEAERQVKAATSKLAKVIGDEDGKHGTILWTSGGTESDALGVLGAARRNKRHKHVVVGQIEHPAVRECAKMLCGEGWTMSELPANESGSIDPEAVDSVVTAETGVLAVMLVNNELGTILPVAEIARRARAINPDIHVHCDAVQALGKIPVKVAALGVDSLAFAAHKLHGPKGVGAFWLAKGARIAPLWTGGGQQEGLRSGTHNVPGIAGMGEAVRLAEEDREERAERFDEFTHTLLGAFDSAGLRYSINGGEATRAGHVLSLAFDKCPAEPLLHVLESRGVLVSAGSACAEKSKKPSPVLSAIGTPKSSGTLRLSFGRETSAEDILLASEIIIDAVKSFQ